MSECLIVKGSGETDLPIVHIVYSLEEARHAVLSLMYSNPDDAEDTDELFAEFDDTMADDNYWTIAFEIGGISVERVCLAAPTQGADVRLPALPKALWTVGEVRVFTEHQMQGYANAALALNRADDAQGADARPVAIYQRQGHDGAWVDTDGIGFDGWEGPTRIVYATHNAAPNDAISDVLAERERQDAQWGGQDHDDQHTKADWQNYIYRQHYAASSFCGTPEQYRVRLVKIAALAVAAIESIDRLAASAPREET